MGLLWHATIAALIQSITGLSATIEEFYRQNYERLSPHRKVAAIVGTCTGQLLPGDAELATIIRRLADQRNALVHPKAKEVKPKARPSQQPFSTEPWNPPADSVRDMERFFQLFLELDPQAIGAMPA